MGKAAAGCCRGDITSLLFTFYFSRQLAASAAAGEKTGITHIWPQSCVDSLESAALVSTKSVGSHTWNVIIADVDE